MKKMWLLFLVLLSVINNLILPRPTFLDKLTMKKQREKIKRLWDCGTEPKKHGCTPEEIKKGKRMLALGLTGVVGGVLLFGGVVEGVILRDYIKTGNRIKEIGKELEKKTDELRRDLDAEERNKIGNEIETLRAEREKLKNYKNHLYDI